MGEACGSLVEGLHGRSIHTHFQGPGQLVVSRQQGPAWPSAGNSFWIGRVQGQWYLCTWVPVCYQVPASAALVSLCTDFADRGTCAQDAVPVDLVEGYGLAELTEEVGKLFGSDEGTS
jgi:hypothetical protein